MARLKDIIQQKSLFWADAGQSVAEVAQKMTALNIGAILILDNGELRGIFSERDLMARVVVPGLDPNATVVDAVMSKNLTKAQETANVQEAMELMRNCGCRHLPVLRGAQVVGFISMRDLMLHELEQKTEELQEIHRYIQSA